MKKYMNAAIYNDPNEVKEEETKQADENLGEEAAATVGETGEAEQPE